MDVSVRTDNAGVYSPLQGIVEDPTFKSTNYLTYNRVYSKVGSTTVISASPAVLHFGGFEVGNLYKQILRITNVSVSDTRVHIIPPTTPFFKTKCLNKRGSMAPGLHEEVEIEFCPQQWRYYYDCVRIHSEAENLLVPLHAYPVMNDTKFPKRIDFGKCAIGDTVKKKVKMECKVPIEFEFNIRIVKANPSFEVAPLSGLVPANGHISIQVSFTPTVFSTEELQIEVNVAEFNSAPVLCTIVGSGFPSLSRNKVVSETVGQAKTTMEELDGTATLKALSTTRNINKGGGTLRGGAGNGDAYTNYIMFERKEKISMRDCRKTGPIVAKMPKMPSPAMEAKMNGVYVPETTMSNHSEVTYVLNQEPGKLRIRDVQDAVSTRHAAQAKHEAALEEVLAAGITTGLHPLEQTQLSASIKESLFRLQLQQAEADAKRVSLGSYVYVGQEVMLEDEIADCASMRVKDSQQYQAVLEKESLSRLAPMVEESGSLHLPSPPTNDASGQGSWSCTPTWTLLESNDWRKRTFAMRRFIEAVRIVVIKRRVGLRLDRIREVLAELGHSKERVAEEAHNPTLLAPPSDRPGTSPVKMLRAELVRYRNLPLYRHVNFPKRSLMTPSHYTDFGEVTPQTFQTPLKYKLLGYTPEPFPGITPYAGTMLDQSLMEGAVEELQAAPAWGVAPSPSDLPTMPDAIGRHPFVLLEIGNRYTEDKVYALPGPSWGMDLEHLLQPRELAFHDSGRVELAGSGSVRALTGIPMLSDTWRPRMELQIGVTPLVTPDFMPGPDPSDILKDHPADADKPPAQFRVPTDDDIMRFLPPSLVESLSQEGTPPHYTLPRSEHQDKLDEMKRRDWQTCIERHVNKLDEYNKLLNKPCYFSVTL